MRFAYELSSNRDHFEWVGRVYDNVQLNARVCVPLFGSHESTTAFLFCFHCFLKADQNLTFEI